MTPPGAPLDARPRNRAAARRATAVVILIGAALTGHAAGQSAAPAAPQARFRASVNHVTLEAVAVDRQGTVVSGLQPAEFEVLEDGRPQKLESVRLVTSSSDLPGPNSATGPAPEAAEPGPLSNRGGSSPSVYAIVLDDLHTSRESANRAKETARRFVGTCLRRGDVAAVLTTGSQPGSVQDFTTDPDLLLAAIGRFTGNKIESFAKTLARVGCFAL